MRAFLVVLVAAAVTGCMVPEPSTSPSPTGASDAPSDFPEAYLLRDAEIPESLVLANDTARLERAGMTQNPGPASIDNRSQHRFTIRPQALWMEYLAAKTQPKVILFIETAQWHSRNAAQSAVEGAYDDRSNGCRPYHDPSEDPHKILFNQTVFVFLGYENDAGDDEAGRPYADQAVDALLAQNPRLKTWCDWPTAPSTSVSSAP